MGCNIISGLGIILSSISIIKSNVNLSFGILNIGINGFIALYLLFNQRAKIIFEPEKPITQTNKKLLYLGIIFLVLIICLSIIFKSPQKQQYNFKFIQNNLIPQSNIFENLQNSSKNKENFETNSSTSTQNQIEEELKGLSPKQTWLKIREKMQNINTYDEFEYYAFKYGSKEHAERIKAMKPKIDSLPQSFKDNIVKLTKGPYLDEITDIQETINGNTAILNVETKTGMKGEIVLVLEDMIWKLKSESWIEK